jgi:hypothetical protein
MSDVVTVPEPTGPALFESKVTREGKTGVTTIFMKSPVLEDVFSTMSAGRTTDQSFNNGAVRLHGRTDFVKRAKVYYSDSLRFASDTVKMYWSESPFYDGGPSLVSLCVVGLRDGITWRIDQPMTTAQLRTYAERLKAGTRAVLESVRAVEIDLRLVGSASATKVA